MPKYIVTVTARRVTDVEQRVGVVAKSKAAARAQVELMMAEERLREDDFEVVDKPRLVSMHIEETEEVG